VPFRIFSLLRSAGGERYRQAWPDQYRGEKCTERMGSYLKAKVPGRFLYFLYIYVSLCVPMCVCYVNLCK
jgi:hypothetical protein